MGASLGVGWLHGRRAVRGPSTIRSLVRALAWAIALLNVHGGIPQNVSAAPAERSVLLADFTAFGGPRNEELETIIRNAIVTRLKAAGIVAFKHSRTTTATIAADLAHARSIGSDWFVTGFYRANRRGGMDLYAQVYDPQTGLVIDAYSVAEIAFESRGIRLPDDERRTPDQAALRLAEKIGIALRANPRRIERGDNIREHLTNSPIARAMPFPVKAVDARRRTDEVFQLFGEEKVVTAARRGQRITEAPSNVVVITGDMIRRRGYLTLTELLQDVPYFDFTTFHDGGEYPTNFLLRGLTDVGQTKVLTMEDGIVQNDVNFGWARNMAYNTTFADVERVEIVLGPGSALYGANAYAGLINVITKQGQDLYPTKEATGWYFDGGGLYGQDGRRVESGVLAETSAAPYTKEDRTAHTYAGDGLAAYRFENGLTVQLAGRWFHADGDGGDRRPDPGNYYHDNFEPKRVFTSEYGIVENDQALGRTKRLRDGFNTEKDSLFFRGKMSYEKFTFGFNYWDRKEGLGSYVPGHEYFANDPEKNYTVHHRGYSAHTAYDFNLTRHASLRTRLYYRASLVLPETGFIYSYRFQSVDRPVRGGNTLAPVPDKCKCYSAQGQVVGLEEQLDLQLSSTNTLVVGAQWERVQRQFLGISLGERQDPESNIVPFSFSDTGPFNQTTKSEVFYTSNGALFLQDEQRFFKEYSVTGGVRYDVLSDVDGADHLRVDGRLVSAGVLNLRMGLVGNPKPPVGRAFNFKLLYGEAFKSPTLFELFDEFRGNPNLRPQRIQTYEATTAFTPLKALTLNAGYFISMLQDVIEIRPNDGSIPIGSASQKETFSQNVEATHMYGANAGVRVQIGRAVYVHGDYTYTADRDRKTPLDVQTAANGKVTEVTLSQDGHEIDNIAARKMNLAVNYVFREKYNFNLRANRVGRRKAPVTNKYFQPYDVEFVRKNYDYEVEGTPDGYMSGYTLWHFTFSWRDALGYAGLEPQLIVRNVFNTAYAGIGRQAGSSIRPLSAVQPDNANPPGFIPPYHPQPGREILFRVMYRF